MCFIASTYKTLLRKLIYAHLSQIVSNKNHTRFITRKDFVFPFCAIHPSKRFLQIMTPFCIFPIYAGDKRPPLGNIARLAFKSALKSWKLISSSWKEIFLICIWHKKKGKRKQLIGLLGLGAERFDGDILVKYLTKALALNLEKTGHLPPGRRCQGLESPASRKSSCHEAGCRGMGKSSLENSA